MLLARGGFYWKVSGLVRKFRRPGTREGVVPRARGELRDIKLLEITSAYYFNFVDCLTAVTPGYGNSRESFLRIISRRYPWRQPPPTIARNLPHLIDCVGRNLLPPAPLSVPFFAKINLVLAGDGSVEAQRAANRINKLLVAPFTIVDFHRKNREKNVPQFSWHARSQ